jgi:hypothetical protein
MEDQVMADENQNQAAGGSAAGDQGGGSAAADSLDAVMGAYVATAKQLPGVVPELISGKNLNEINASIDTAKAAYARVAGQVAPAAAAGGAATPPPPVVGTGAVNQTAGQGEEIKFTSEGGYNKILAGIEGKNRQSR